MSATETEGPFEYLREPVGEGPYEVQVAGPCDWVTFSCFGEAPGQDSSSCMAADHEEDFGPITETFPAHYGVRWSMPGYLDCSEWDLYATRGEAERAAGELRYELAGEEEEEFAEAA